jgi:hypothetical protein
MVPGMRSYLFGGVLLAAFLPACGFTDEEMAAKQRQIDALTAKVTALRTEARASTCPLTSSSSSQRRR